MTRLLIAFSGALLVAAVDLPPWVLKPEAAQTIQSAFDRMRPALSYESIQLDRDHVQARVCESADHCFAVRLGPPEGPCAGRVAGPFCVAFPDGAPSSAATETIENALRVDKGGDLWTASPPPPPPPPPAAKSEPPGPPGIGPAWSVRDPITPGHVEMVALILVAALLSLRKAWRDLGLMTAVALAAGLWLDQVNPQAWAGDDESAGMLLAQDCVKLSVCHLTSIDSGVTGFVNGAVWLHLLALVGMLGGTTVAVRMVVICLMAAGVGVVFLTVRRWIGPAFALPAAVFALYGLSTGNELSASNLVDASAVFFPAALSACALLVFVRTQRLSALILSALLLSHATNTHVAAASLWPALILSSVLFARRPVVGGVIAVGSYLVMTLITSRFALMDSWGHLPTATHWILVTGWIAVVGIGAWVHPRFLALGTKARTAVLGTWLLLPHGAGVLWLHAQHRPPTGRYLPPIVAPLAVLAAVVLVVVLGRIAGLVRAAWLGRWGAVAVGCACLATAPPPHTAGSWTFEDGRIAAQHLENRGWCQAQQFARVQGPQCTSFAFAAIPYACKGPADTDFRRQVRVWVADGRQLPAMTPSVEVVPARGDRVLLMSEVSSWVDKQHPDLCFTTPAGRACTQPEEADPEPFLYSRRLALGFGNALHEAPYTMSFSFPLAPAAGESHRFSFVDDARSFGADPGHENVAKLPKCGWQIVQATGLESDRPLPANPVTFTSKDGAPGRLVVERVVGGDCGSGFPGRQIPCHLETTTNDPPWMQPREPAGP